MHAVTYRGINEFLVEMSKLLLNEGRKRTTRGKTCYELPEPVMVKITQPTARIVHLKERRWNKVLPYAESLWIASGRNDLSMMTPYLDRLRDFSDDGEYLRGAYGPRIRGYNGKSENYKRSKPAKLKTDKQKSIDQLLFVSECFKRDENTRQATIALIDPIKDYFCNNFLIETKDFPCTLSLHFIKNTKGKLDLRTTMRSNDFVWGATGVNIFNYTFMLEYVSAIVGIEMGDYYHTVNNLHYYEEFKDKLHTYSQLSTEDMPYVYRKEFATHAAFIEKLTILSDWEEKLRRKDIAKCVEFEDDFFDDWATVLFNYHTNSSKKYINPALMMLK